MVALDTIKSKSGRQLAGLLYESRDFRFWFFQLVGWSGYAMATFLTITVAENNISAAHLGHIGLTVFLGILVSWPMRPLYRRCFDLPLPSKIVIATFAVLSLSALWTVLRIVVFAWLVGETAIWSEFNYWYYGSLFVFLSWTVLYFGARYYELLVLEHQKLLRASALQNEEKIRRLQAEQSTREAHLQMLRYQLNPHFLFNTLNSIKALVTLKENDKAGEMLQQLSGFLRHTLEESAEQYVSLDHEMESLMLYLEIEKARFEDRLRLEIEIEPRARQAMVPSMILQPLIENSMKYAVATSEDGGTVRVKADITEQDLHLEVSDTGPGITGTEIGEGRGIGLRNTLERLEAYYERNCSFNISDMMPSGMSIQIRIPFQTDPPALTAQGARA